MNFEKLEREFNSLSARNKVKEALILITNIINLPEPAHKPYQKHCYPFQSKCDCYDPSQSGRKIKFYKKLREYILSLDEKVLLGKLNHRIGVTYFNLSDYVLAREELLDSYSLLRNSSENETIAEIQKYLGWCAARLGKLKEAENYLTDSMSSYRRVGKDMQVAKIKNTLSHMYFIQFQWDRALEQLNDCVDLCKEHKNYNELALYLGNMAPSLLYMGEWVKAKQYLKKSLKLKRKIKSYLSSCPNLLLLGKLSTLKRDFSKAVNQFNEAMQDASEKGMKREIAIGHEYLGELAFEQGDYDQAEEQYERAREIAEAIAPEGDLINELYRRIADLKVKTGDLKIAWKATERALEVSKNLGDRYEESLTYRARGLILKEEGKKKEALEHFNRCLKILTSVGEKYERARTHLEIGILLRESKKEEDLHQADLHLQQAMDLFEEIDVDYYKAVTAVEMAKVHVALQDDEMVLGRLKYAEELTKETVDEDKVDIQTREICRALEESIVDRALAAKSDENPLAAAAASTLGYPYNMEGLEKILADIMGHVRATRGFIARRQSENGQFKVSVAKSLELPASEQILGHFKSVDKRILSMKRPFLSIDVLRDGRFDPLWSDVLFGINSLAVIPFGVEGELDGICYVDREACISSGPFLYREIEQLVSLGKSLAFFVTAMERDELRKGNRYLSSQLDRRAGFKNIITQDPRMFELLDMVDRVKNSKIPVLLIGETGTGKELVAKAIHYSGVRKNRRHIAVNCAALPDNLLESELFGHKRGSFTGATVDKKGLLEVADKGTFFLDEIADMGLAIQVKLLRFLESGEIKRLGDTVVRQVDVRIISATNKDLTEEVHSGRFREDLFYRLNGIKIGIPPLRERRADIPLLISHFIEMFSMEEEKEIEGITPDAMNVLVSYDWPGNVRELMNEIHRAMTLIEDGGEIGIRLITDRVKSAVRGGVKGTEVADLGNTLPELMASFERQQIFMALRNSGWVKTRAAKDLGIHEATLRGKMRRYGLSVPGDEG